MMLVASPFGYLADYALWWLALLSLIVHAWCFFRLFPLARRRVSGLLFGNALIFVILLTFAALLGETYYRFLAVETDAFGVSLPARRWFALHVRLNALGCRDREWSLDRPPDVYRIAFVGDSFTYGWGIERVRDRFPDRIAALFARDAGRTTLPGSVTAAEVFNVAKPGWGTGDQIQPVRDMIDVYAVDEVVLCYVPNDIEKLLPRSEEFDPIRPPEPRWINPTGSALFDSLYYRICVPRMPTVRGYHDWLAEGFAEPDFWKRHQRQLYSIVEICRRRDVRLRVVLLPFLRTAGTKYDAADVHTVLRSFFEANGVEVLDLLRTIDETDVSRLTVSRYDAHPNETAHARFADRIFSAFYAAPNERTTEDQSRTNNGE